MEILRRRVAIFEDEEGLRNLIRSFFNIHGFEIVGEAGSRSEADQLIDQLRPDGLDLATVDNNLKPKEYSNTDGEHLTARLHTECTGVVVVGISGLGEVVGADYNVAKEAGIVGIGEVILQAAQAA